MSHHTSIIEPLEQRRLLDGSVLFIRGADRSGGFIEATNDAQRTEQLASITNASTAAGNHGWDVLADLLRGNGYTVTEVKETLEAGAPSTGQTQGQALNLAGLNLTQYRAVVMASNNAVYSTASVNALEAYIRGGGGVLFISDGNFGSHWADSPNSDNQFLSRFGLAANQDNGTYVVSRAQGDFAAANHPILIGVDAFDGEGVSPIRVPVTPPAGVTITRVVGARGTTCDNNPASSANQFRGTSRSTDSRDAALVLANAGAGRIAAHFDRNTFFNPNGAGTDITRFDNTQLALNLFNWVSDNAPPAVVSSSFTQGAPYELKFRLNDNLNGSFTRSEVRLVHRKTGVKIPSSNWSFTLTEGNGFTDVTIRIKSSTTLGPYQLQVERRTFGDDSGNVRTGAIRYAFTLLPVTSSLNIEPASKEDRESAFSTERIIDSLV